MIAVETYTFRPEDLSPQTRQPGVAAFMRIRNGADFLEAAIRSHIPHFDEIVAVYNQCTDATPDILVRLEREFGDRLRVFHYLPPVFPPGSSGHRAEPPESPASLVNYYNFALTRTRHRIVTKLDDDHLAIEPALAEVTRRIRDGGFGEDEMICFSGANLARDAAGRIGILAGEPFSGAGDIGFFRVSNETCFVHDPRFERFRRGGLRRRFAGFLYWHLKYLKPGFGFANYDLDRDPDSRYARRRQAIESGLRVVGSAELPELASPLRRLQMAARRIGLPLPEKSAILADRQAAAALLPQGDICAALLDSSPAATLLPFLKDDRPPLGDRGNP